MGTEVHHKSSGREYYSMREVNEDSNSSSWSIFYGDKTLSNGHYYNGFIPRTVTDAYPGHDKDALKQKMLEHEAVFKNQVYELHRLYRIQRDMMEEVKRKELHKHRISIDTSSSSSHLPSQKPFEDPHKWQIPSFPLAINSSPLSCSRGNNNNNNNNNNTISKDSEILDSRPSKVRKKLFDLELPPDENVDNEEQVEDSGYKDTSSGQRFRGSNGLADLNEPVHVEEPMAHVSLDRLGPSAKPTGSQFLGRHSGVFNHLAIEGKSNGRDWLSNTRETGNSRSNMHFTPGNYSEISTRLQDHSHFNQTPLPFTTSRISSSYPFVNSPDFGNSLGKPNGSLTHKLASFQKHPSFVSSPQSHEVFGDKWRTNGYYNKPNGFYHGSPSGSKEPSAHLPFDRQNCSNIDERSKKIFKGSNFIDLTETTKGMDLNTVQTVSNDENGARKCDETGLPWLRTKNGVTSLANNGKILGFPVFGNSCVSKNESSSLASTSASLRFAPENGKIKTETETRGFDINVAWDDPEMEKETGTEIEKVKNQFDLNSCVTEEEDFIVTESVKRLSEKMEIDLEAPAVPEVEEEDVADMDKSDSSEEEALAKVAADAIVMISGQQDQAGPTTDVADVDDLLLWFVEVIENENAGSIFNELDEYEALTLELEETKEEDYMPKPLAPEFQEPDETGLGLSSGPVRPRRGQARRGRPRRDFQRDILPGLVSLSRHEVTEDLQIFGGLMKATGHSWNVGLTRRNGTRGRRKAPPVAIPPPPVAIPPPPVATLPPPVTAPPALLSERLNNMEERSLTGWGKTTRRPRRQRCGGGSSVAVPLT